MKQLLNAGFSKIGRGDLFRHQLKHAGQTVAFCFCRVVYADKNKMLRYTANFKVAHVKFSILIDVCDNGDGFSVIEVRDFVLRFYRSVLSFDLSKDIENNIVVAHSIGVSRAMIGDYFNQGQTSYFEKRKGDVVAVFSRLSKGDGSISFKAEYRGDMNVGTMMKVGEAFFDEK